MTGIIGGLESDNRGSIEYERLNEPLVCATCGEVVRVVSAPGASQLGLLYHHQILQDKSDIMHYSQSKWPLIVGHDHLVKKSEFQATA